MSIRTLIIDDESLARDGIRMLLAADTHFEIIGECDNGREAIDAIMKQSPDLIFLDVQMPEVDGLGVLRALAPDRIPMVVFVTAFDRFAIDAFDAHALDYVLKPVNPGRFVKTLERIKTRYDEREITQISHRLVDLLRSETKLPIPSTGQGHLSRFSIRTGDRIYFVDAAEVDWLEADDYYVKIHVGKQSHLIRETLTNIEQQLDPSRFVRIHRSTIVNTSRIKELKQHFRGEYFVILKDGTKLKLSRTHRDAVARIVSGR